MTYPIPVRHLPLSYMPAMITHTSHPEIPKYKAFFLHPKGFVFFLRIFQNQFKPDFKIILENRKNLEIIEKEPITLFVRDNIRYFLPYEYVATRDCEISYVTIEFEGYPVIRFCFEYQSTSKKIHDYWPALALKKGESLSMGKIAFQV